MYDFDAIHKSTEEYVVSLLDTISSNTKLLTIRGTEIGIICIRGDYANIAVTCYIDHEKDASVLLIREIFKYMLQQKGWKCASISIDSSMWTFNISVGKI